jgi:hypothetical protein
MVATSSELEGWSNKANTNLAKKFANAIVGCLSYQIFNKYVKIQI